jgi:hypothetical protein
MDKPHQHHAHHAHDKQAGKPEPQHEPSAAPAPKEAKAPATPGIAVAPRHDLGDHEVGTQSFTELAIFNADEMNEGHVTISLVGDPTIALVSKPEQLRPSREGFDPASKVRLVFSPLKKGHVRGELRVTMSWLTGTRLPETTVVTLEGAAHQHGQPELAGVEREQQEHDAAAAAAGERERTTQAAEAAADARDRAEKLSGNEFWRSKLTKAEADAGSAIARLYNNRRAGLTTARGELIGYKQRPPENHPSVAEQLALAAIDIATAGIAGGLAKRLEGALLAHVSDEIKVVRHWHNPGRPVVVDPGEAPSKAVVAFFTDGTKAGLKQVAPKPAKGGHAAPVPAGAASQASPRTSGAGASDDPLLAFLQTHDVHLAGQQDEQAMEVAGNARRALEPMLDTNPKGAVEIMKRGADAVRSEPGDRTANTQATATVTHWLNYVARDALGEVQPAEAAAQGKRADPSGEATTDIEPANAAPSFEGKVAPVKGLVDVAFTGDLAHPEVPVRVAEIRVYGVKDAVAKRLRHSPLKEAHVAVRAYGTGVAGIPVTVARDEAGNVRYSDETGVPGMPGHWLGRKVGLLAGGEEAQAKGAKQLIEEEIMAQPLNDAPVKTDDLP